MPLHTKYRPSNFKTMIGNEAIIESLQNILERDEEDLTHSYLIDGPHGSGKTTLARIMAKELGAEKMAIHEVDSADFRGIDTIRDLRRKIQLKPLAGNRVVWILDECHKMTPDAQNALLKALEEPPPHVFFFLCTTDPQKLIKTIRSRCTTFSVSTLNETQTLKLLNRVVKRERKKVPEKVLKQIALDSLGHARDALTILDKIIDIKPENMLKLAKKTAAKENKAIDLCRALINGKNWPEVAKIIKGLDADGLEGTRQAVLGYCRNILLKGENNRAFFVMDIFIENNFFNTGMSGLVHACYEIIQGE